ncbi:hypothetical protein PHYPSEUDO_005864 [Phytophthora pseudosyringae]|uniref:RING-type domain-containing protein n=1 Tax=Phytophthora pseudosyringae TaxID=221518 RepID=A0A8T1WBS7_9STRA|nr:hypothetical protein PHYPSEUDO_005864 [Phytophthora pseudosyringae]
MATERGRTRRRPRPQLGLEAPAKEHLAQQVAGVVALSLQRNRRESGRGGLSGAAAGKRGLLASTLRLAEQNVADMTAFLRRQEAEAAAVVVAPVELPSWSEGEEHEVCVICLDGDMVPGESAREGERVEALPCGHVFHARCIAQWLLHRRVCPVDRRPVD